MEGCAMGVGRKRTLTNPCSSPCTSSKHPRFAWACTASSTSFAESASSTSSSDSHFDAPHARGSSQPSSAARSPASSSTSVAISSDPFPRYTLGIPRLDVLLPSRDGLDLLHAYHQGLGWILSPVDRTTLLETLEEAERHGADSIHPHRLACLLAALALGDLFSDCFPSPSSSRQTTTGSPSKRGKIWFGVASACLASSRTNTDPMQNPTPDACSALYLMSIYLLCSNDEELFHRSHGLTGLALSLAKSALVPSCIPSKRLDPPAPTAETPTASWQRAPTCSPDSASSPGSPPRSATPINAMCADQDRLLCNRLLSDLIFHLRCQELTFSFSCNASQPTSPHISPSLARIPNVPTIQAIWTALGTPLYDSLDAFGSRYNPNIFHNWKLGLADLMHQVSCLTNQATTLENLASPSSNLFSAHADSNNHSGSASSMEAKLPDHTQIVKLDERIRRYHASLPDFLLLHRPLPVDMAGKVDEDELAQILCQRHMACSLVHRMLMALHRPWFLSALACRSHSSTIRSAQRRESKAAAETADSSLTPPQAPDSVAEQSNPGTANAEKRSAPGMFSLSAVLRSATWQTETFASASVCAPSQAVAWWQLTNNALAAAVVQATALLRLSCPFSCSSISAPVTNAAPERSAAASLFHKQVRTDLDKNICSFQNIAERCNLAAKALPFLQRVCSAIDLGICKSRNETWCAQGDLQTSLGCQDAVQPHCNLETFSSSINTTAQMRAEGVWQPSACNSNILNNSSNSNSNISSNSNILNSNSNSNSSDLSNISNSNNSNNSNNRRILICEPSHTSNPCLARSTTAQLGIGPHHTSKPYPSSAFPQTNSSAIPQSTNLDEGSTASVGEPRRASSTKSELENLFGPLASGLELSAPCSTAAVKPLYRQNLDPIPLAPCLVRDADEHSSQPSCSDDVGSSSASSGMIPCTPKGPRSPQVHPSQERRHDSTEDKEWDARATQGGGHGKDRSDDASDLVLRCIRFWQPDALSTRSPPPTPAGRGCNQ